MGVSLLNGKLGLINNVDVQFVADSYIRSTARYITGATTTVTGFGDLATRVKVNFWGNDGAGQPSA